MYDNQLVEEGGQFFLCAVPAVMIDQDMVGNRICLHLRNPLELLQCLGHRLMPLTAVRTRQCDGRAFKGECVVGWENNANGQDAGYEGNVRHVCWWPAPNGLAPE